MQCCLYPKTRAMPLYRLKKVQLQKHSTPEWFCGWLQMLRAVWAFCSCQWPWVWMEMLQLTAQHWKALTFPSRAYELKVSGACFFNAPIRCKLTANTLILNRPIRFLFFALIANLSQWNVPQLGNLKPWYTQHWLQRTGVRIILRSYLLLICHHSFYRPILMYINLGTQTLCLFFFFFAAQRLGLSPYQNRRVFWFTRKSIGPDPGGFRSNWAAIKTPNVIKLSTHILT